MRTLPGMQVMLLTGNRQEIRKMLLRDGGDKGAGGVENRPVAGVDMEVKGINIHYSNEDFKISDVGCQGETTM